jgi:hypothetical protein
VRDDFAAFILTHGRPDRVRTIPTLAEFGYTGRVYVVIDDEDKTADEYRRLFGDRVLTFSKAEVAREIDEGDNFHDRRVILYARNACFDLARQVGVSRFIQLDDDYTGFYFRFDTTRRYGVWRAECLDELFESLVDFLDATPALSVCISQGGDHIGGGGGSFGDAISATRKAMNTFVCSTERPFKFFGRINEDVNTYTTLGRRGDLFLTVVSAQVNQHQTQGKSGGMTEFYLESGTYVKSFYSVMYSPSCVKISEMGSAHRRIHHRINWNATTPMILAERWRKAA